jgi:hypothetical protein
MMSDKEFYESIFTLNHKPDCDWHADQYWWECTCGAVTLEIREEYFQRKQKEMQE